MVVDRRSIAAITIGRYFVLSPIPFVGIINAFFGHLVHMVYVCGTNDDISYQIPSFGTEMGFIALMLLCNSECSSIFVYLENLVR
ncbi:hypothetical protein PanWU01x14_338590 [Parasponia andersonii]|uniref:Uncharacterized protein n=1 Tax=Parasponia andersonii TaxID=3476 RepID=A0A2P5AF31_PARAD|nr:hypothetical protein PanWU01x14_338590 [Parasponia andersonii]